MYKRVQDDYTYEVAYIEIYVYNVHYDLDLLIKLGGEIMKTKKHLKKVVSTVMISAVAVSNVPVMDAFGADAYKWAIDPQFYHASEFSEGLAVVTNENNDRGYVDRTGNLVIPYQFKEANRFSEGLAGVRNENNEWGYIDKTGKLVIPYQFSRVNEFGDGLARVSLEVDGERKEGYIDTMGTMVMPMDSSIGEFSEGLARVEVDYGTWGYIDTKGNIAITPQFNMANEFSEGLALVSLEVGEGYIDHTGNIVISYDGNAGLGNFSEGLAFVNDYDKGRAYINTAGEIAIPYGVIDGFSDEIMDVGDFNSGLARISLREGTGYIDTTGELVIPYITSLGGDFSEGLAPVMDEDGIWGYISSPYATATAPSVPSKPVAPTLQPVAVLQPKVIFKGSPLNVNGDILALNNRTYYPFRDLLDSVGAVVEWNNDTKTATGTLNGNTVQFTVDKAEYVVNGETVKMDDAKLLVSNGKTYIPIRYVLEGLGFTVGWDGATSSITVE